MELSSLARLRRYCGKLTDNSENNNALQALLLSVSANIEEYLFRELEFTERTEYFDSEEGQRIWYPKAYPVASIASVYTTVTGKFEGEETSNTDFHVTYNRGGIVLRRNIGRYLRAVKVTYTGGLAADPVRSTYTIGTVGASAFEEDQYVKGSRSRAVGRVIANSPSTDLEIEVLYGKFRVGDVLTAYQLEDLSGQPIASTSGTITAIVSQSLVESHPAVVMACEIEVNYLYRNSNGSSLWTQSTTKEGSNKRLLDSEYNLQPETRMMLRGYARELL